MITISADWLRANWDTVARNGYVSLTFSRWDGGDAFTQALLGPLPSRDQVEGLIVMQGRQNLDAPVVIQLSKLTQSESPNPGTFVASDGFRYVPFGQSRDGNSVRDHQVAIVEIATALAERRKTLLESTLLQDAKVAVFGLGTGGIHVAVELAKAGVGHFWLIDSERLEVGNVSRHHVGLSQVGRRKTLAARDMILEKNPQAAIDILTSQADLDTVDDARRIISKVDAVVGATDGRPSKLFINRISVEEAKPVVFGGAFRRAYGGQVFRVRPYDSPCYQCFVMAIPDAEADTEIASSRDAAQIAYSDQPVPIEPGLSLDVAPIALMVARLTLGELLRARESTLRVLDRDLSAPWYIWVNRPEPGTPYAGWPPLSESVDEMTVLRWYGIELTREPTCPACGDFGATISEKYRIDPSTLPSLPVDPGSADTTGEE